MLKFLLILAIIISIIGIYAIGLEDFIKLIRLFIEKIVDEISQWFQTQQADLIPDT